MAKQKYVYDFKKKQWFFKIVKIILSIFLRKPKEIVNENNEPIEEHALFLPPHHGKWGPMWFNVHSPFKLAIVGAHQMLGSYKDRFHYLRDVLYIQKNHKGKFSSTIKAAIEAIFSKMIYKGMHLIPSYEDIRFYNTINLAVKNIENGFRTIIFSENSEDGYFDVLTKLHPGFILIAQKYNSTHEKELPIYPIYFHHKKRKIVYGKKEYLSELLSKGYKKEDLTQYFLDKINGLHDKYFVD